MNDSKRKEELVVQLRQLADEIETKKDFEFDDCISSLRDIIYKSTNVPIPSLDTLETALDEIYDSKSAHSEDDPNSNSNSNSINNLPESEYVSTRMKQIKDRFTSQEREAVMSTAFTQGNLNQIVFRSDFHRRIKQVLTKRFYLFDSMGDDYSIANIVNCATTKMNRLLLNEFLNTNEDTFKQTVVTLYDNIIALSKSKKQKKKREERGEEEKTGTIEHRERKNDSEEDENELDSSLLWLTQEDFVEYLCDDSNFSQLIKTKHELQLNGLFVILFEIGVFWKLVDKIVNAEEKVIAWNEEMVVKCIECGLIDVSFVNNNNQSLYHIATACNDTSMFDKLLEIDNEGEIYKDSANRVTFRTPFFFSWIAFCFFCVCLISFCFSCILDCFVCVLVVFYFCCVLHL